MVLSLGREMWHVNKNSRKELKAGKQVRNVAL